MQNRDGGWAAFDVDIDNEVLTKVPFADHNAMLDPSCADITARVLELLGTLGYRADHPAVAAGSGLPLEDAGAARAAGTAAGASTTSTAPGRSCRACRPSTSRWTTRAIQRAADWLESVQQPGGGWGETCRQLRRPRTQGDRASRRASQTAWAILGLIAAGRAQSARPSAAASSTCSTPSAPTAPGTRPSSPAPASPGSSTSKYHLYRVYFPLMALARYRPAVGADRWASPRPRRLASRIPAQPAVARRLIVETRTLDTWPEPSPVRSPLDASHRPAPRAPALSAGGRGPHAIPPRR